jgi:hypothetical protein
MTGELELSHVFLGEHRPLSIWLDWMPGLLAYARKGAHLQRRITSVSCGKGNCPASYLKVERWTGTECDVRRENVGPIRRTGFSGQSRHGES